MSANFGLEAKVSMELRWGRVLHIYEGTVEKDASFVWGTLITSLSPR